MVVSCNKCERVFVISKTARLQICKGCDVGFVCWMCRGEQQDEIHSNKSEYYCRDCEIVRKEQKKLDELKKKAEIMLDDWMKVNPTWEEKEKAEYLAAKASKAENKWNRVEKISFVQNKLTNFIKVMKDKEDMNAILALRSPQPQ